VLILDDTILKRNRSKKVELLARVHDHNEKRYYWGFRCLTLCFHLGNAIIPIDFRLLSSRQEKRRKNNGRQDLDRRSNGYKLRQYALSDSYTLAFDMIGRQRGLARHVLFDSWFAMPVMFRTLCSMGFHGVGMLKTSNNLYRYKGKLYSLEALYAIAKQFIHHEKDFATLGVELVGGMPLSITFVLDRRSKKDWIAIATTDLSLSPQKVLSLYARRWNIEVFFKTVKTCLGFASECKSRSLDAIVCSVAVVFTRHMILTWMNFGMPEPETLGQMFFLLFDEMHECTVSEALAIVLREIIGRFVYYDEPLDMTLREFFTALPDCFKLLKAVS
jgi:IS4 transposase